MKVSLCFIPFLCIALFFPVFFLKIILYLLMHLFKFTRFNCSILNHADNYILNFNAVNSLSLFTFVTTDNVLCFYRYKLKCNFRLDFHILLVENCASCV